MNILSQLKLFYTDKHILVTGGAGFIGSHLVDALVNIGAQVTVLDDLSRGKLSYLDNSWKAIRFIQGSVCDEEMCLQALKGQEILFHLAAFTSVPLSIKSPQSCYQINVEGTRNILNASLKTGLSRFIFSSSAAVYGAVEGLCTETTPCDPLSPYGRSKWEAEQLCKSYAEQALFKVIILRYFNVYGARQDVTSPYSGAHALFHQKMQTNTPVHIFGDGSYTRDFTPVTQVVKANILLGQLPENAKQCDIYNIASGTSCSIIELYNNIKTEYPHYTLPPLFYPPREGDIPHSNADCTKYFNITRHI